MKKVLGLDLGVTSIGWAMIAETDDGSKEILGMGSRIIPLSTDDKDEFASGKSISKNQKRTQKRTQRKGYDRYQQRRSNLSSLLAKNKMSPDDSLMKLSAVELFGLRDRALKEKISLSELGRVLYHLNQKRGYKSSRSDANLDKKDTEYVADVKSRHQSISEKGLTIGQYFYNNLKADNYYRVKNQVFPREAYVEEFEAICKKQSEFHPELTPELIDSLRDENIYFQRKLKSQKGLVSICEFEGFHTTDKNGKNIFAGPKVTPRSSPLFQVCKIWESINTITLRNKRGEVFTISIEKKKELFNLLDNNEKLTLAEIFKTLGLKKEDGWYGNKQLEKGLQGNLTKTALTKLLSGNERLASLLHFDIVTEFGEEETFLIDRTTGEIKGAITKKIISGCFEKQPLYQLWHTIYSIADIEECVSALQKKFNISGELAQQLAALDFRKAGFGNKSAKAIRKMLPYLMDGFVYSDAASFAGYNHSDSLTKEENLKRALLSAMPLLPKNSLRQPIVEKILNQLINLVNALIKEYGAFGKHDEIRIELARELKQSKDERNDTFRNLNKREKENEVIRKKIEQEYRHLGIRATRNNVIKWRLFHEISDEVNRLNATCIYCGQPFSLTDALSGNSIDIEHIIPKSRLFDDSQSNKTLSHRKCNLDKDNNTAFDFIQTKSEQEIQRYLDTVDDLYKRKVIGKAKRDKLLMSSSKIPQDFIERQLRETQYIARKAKELLEQVCYNVWSTSGSVTEYLRRIWGWDDVLMNLHLPAYRELGMTEWIETEKGNGQLHKKEIIAGWTKRDDHRHHAIDALTIACTKQGFVQRINKLNADSVKDAMRKELADAGREYDKKKSLLENYIFSQKPFSTAEVEAMAANILVSFKAGKRVATISKHKAKGVNLEKGIIVPRGPLSEDSVYGKIMAIEKEKPVKYLFEHPHLIFKPYIKQLVEERLSEHNNDAKKAIASLKKQPIYLDSDKTKLLTYGTCYKAEIVIKKSVDEFNSSNIDSIVDSKIKSIVKARLEQFDNKPKEAFKDLENNPVWFNEELKIPIHTVRKFTGLSAVAPVKKDENGKDIGFVKPGNNHHVAIYIDENGNKQEHICTFWHAVERKKYNLPVVIKEPQEVWDKILINKEEYPESFLAALPNDKWTLLHSMQQNEMFILGLSNEEFDSAYQQHNYRLLSKHLYRVQKLSTKNYYFRHHLETSVDETKEAAQSKRFYSVRSLDGLSKLNPIKIIINATGHPLLHHVQMKMQVQ